MHPDPSAQLNRVTGQRISWMTLLQYSVAFPVYDGLKNLVTLAGLSDWNAGERVWRVTPRR